MRQEAKVAVLSALDTAAQEAGSKNLEDALHEARRLFVGAARLMKRMQSIGLEKWLDEYEPDTPEMEMMLVAMAQFITQITRDLVLKGSEAIVKSIPPPPGGRPRISADVKQKVASDILALQGKRVKLSFAKQRVADRYGLSVHSVDNIWRTRDTIDCETPDLAAVLSFMKTVVFSE